MLKNPLYAGFCYINGRFFMVITSRSNPMIVATAALKERKYREKEGLFLIEGIKLFEEALKSDIEIKSIFATKKIYEKCKKTARRTVI